MNTLQYKYDLGSEAEDIVSGLQGILIAVSLSLNGCVRYGLQPRTKEGHDMPDAYNIDESQLRVMTKHVEPEPQHARGGPTELYTP